MSFSAHKITSDEAAGSGTPLEQAFETAGFEAFVDSLIASIESNRDNYVLNSHGTYNLTVGYGFDLRVNGIAAASRRVGCPIASHHSISELRFG